VATPTNEGILAEALSPITNLFSKKYSRAQRLLVADYYVMTISLFAGALIDATRNSLVFLWAALYCLSGLGLVGFFIFLAVARSQVRSSESPLEEDN
jgi:NADH:ubiquinone oxidoreductase subunit 2 (subunit N)